MDLPQRPSLQYLFPDTPAAASARAVADGVFWVRMPLPYALDHINLWALADGDGLTLVDCGLATEATLDSWRQLFAGDLKGWRIKRIIVTHCHPDHIGLAAWLCRECGLEPWMARSEYLTAHALYHRIAGTDYAALQRWWECHGIERGSELPELSGGADHYRRAVPALPQSFRAIRHGDVLAIGAHSWQVIVGHGHSPEHVALHCARLGVLISGDMLLPRISTNIAVWPGEPHGDALGEFLDSIARFDALPADTAVLPSHGVPFRGMRLRISDLRRHHVQRLDSLTELCARPRTASELVPELFQRRLLDRHQLVFAMGETIAHLVYLEQRGILARLTDAHGVHRFVRAEGR